MKENQFVKKMLRTNAIEDEQEEIYRFGLECLFLKTINFLSYILIAILLAKLNEFIFIMLTFVPLRRSAGGYHAQTRIKCYFLSSVVLVMALLMCNFTEKISIWFIILACANIVFLLLAPVDHENKRMGREEKNYFKKKTRIIIVLIDVIVLVLPYVGQEVLIGSIITGVVMATFFLILGKIQEFAS